MKKAIFNITLFFGLIVMAQLSQAQEKKEALQQRNFYRKSLMVDSVKAEQVAQVQDSYKTALGVLMADTSLKEEARRAKIGQLISDKNRKLRLLLNVSQQQKLIPSTEREPVKAERQR